jgi:hypothetical protein
MFYRQPRGRHSLPDTRRDQTDSAMNAAASSILVLILLLQPTQGKTS